MTFNGWTKRKKITLTSSVTLYNYQIRFTLNKGTTTDSGSNIYIPTGEVQSNFQDVRFASSDGQVLPHWIRNDGGTYLTDAVECWVKVPYINIGTTDIYIYWNNSSAPHSSDGSRVFELFDHFEGSVLNPINISSSFTSTSISNSEFYGSCTGANYASGNLLIPNNKMPPPYEVRTRMKFTKSNNAAYCAFLSQVGANIPSLILSAAGSAGDVKLSNCGVGDITAFTTVSSNTYYVCGLQITSTYWYAFVLPSATYTYNASLASRMDYLTYQAISSSNGSTYTSSIWIDWVFVRKYFTSEPTFTFSPSETNIDSYVSLRKKPRRRFI